MYAFASLTLHHMDFIMVCVSTTKEKIRDIVI